MKKLYDFINETKNRELYIINHERRGHALYNHILSDYELVQKVRKGRKPQYVDDIVLATRWISEEQALHAITEALMIRKKEIESWLKNWNGMEFAFQETLSEITGEGIAYNGDWRQPVPVHGIRIVLTVGGGYNPFTIKTAYPINSFGDNDDILDAIYEYQDRRSKKQKT